MTEQTPEQRRAQHALEKIQKLKGEEYGKYCSYVSGLPATILQNGLGQAMATLLSAAKGKQEDAHYLLYKHVEDWLCDSGELAPYKGSAEAPKLMNAIVSRDQDTYIRAQAEALTYLTWLKKFAKALLEEEKVA